MVNTTVSANTPHCCSRTDAMNQNGSPHSPQMGAQRRQRSSGDCDSQMDTTPNTASATCSIRTCVLMSARAREEAARVLGWGESGQRVEVRPEFLPLACVDAVVALVVTPVEVIPRLAVLPCAFHDRAVRDADDIGDLGDV